MINIHHPLPDTNDDVFLVGGSVRDSLLKQRPLDYDIVVKTDPKRYARELAAMHRTRVIDMGRGAKRIWRVVGRNVVFDVSLLKGASIEEDLGLRDFTINAMAWDIRARKLVDIAGGRKDLAGKTVRMVSPAAFDHDPVRLLRAYRIAAKTGFGIEARTTAAIGQKGPMIRLAPGERVRSEWFTLLTYPSAAPAVRAMAAGGLILELFPELADLKKCPGNRHHAYDAFVHTIETFGHLEALTGRLGHTLPLSAARLEERMRPKRCAVLKNAALLHDIGKPAAMTVDEKGGRHFYGHDKTGARMIDGIGRRYKFSNHEREATRFIVRHHLRPLFLFNQAAAAPPGRTRARFFLSCGDLVPDIVLHAAADSRGKAREVTEKHRAFIEFADRLLDDYFTGYLPREKAAPLLDGHDLMRVYGLAPSSLIGTVLRQVQEATIAGLIDTRREALDLAAVILGREKRS